MDINSDQGRGRREAQAAITTYMNADLAASVNTLYDVVVEENADLLAAFYRFHLEVLAGLLGVIEENLNIDPMEMLRDLFLSMETESD